MQHVQRKLKELPTFHTKRFLGGPGVKILAARGPETNNYLRWVLLSVFKHILQLGRTDLFILLYENRL